MSTKRLIQRAVVVAGVAGLTGLMGAGLASAHVTADYYGQEPQKGGRGLIVLRVPNEEADAGTTKVEVAFPAEYGITSARTKPVPGWTAEVTKATLPTPVKNGKGADVAEVISKITWTAQGGTKIAAGSAEYQEFEFNASTLPSTVDTLVLPATQTYENGKVVAWDAPPPPEGGEEPERPAPTIKLAAASSGGDHGHGATASSSEEQASSHNEASAAAGTDNTARWLGGVGLAVGALGLGVGAGATIRARRGLGPEGGRMRRVLVAVLTATALLGFASPALAHNVLVSSDPAKGASLQEGPPRVTLTFDQYVQSADVNQVALTGPDGSQWAEGAVEVKGNVVTAPLRPLGPAGEYTIGFRILSADGHAVSDEIKFTLAKAGTGTPAAADAARSGGTGGGAAEDGSGGVPLWVWIGGAVVLLALGLVFALRAGKEPTKS